MTDSREHKPQTNDHESKNYLGSGLSAAEFREGLDRVMREMDAPSEREAIVAWLRADTFGKDADWNTPAHTVWRTRQQVAHEIENGEHHD